jgi:prepilin-type N-terminal cleavage/methylation domain-containing protein
MRRRVLRVSDSGFTLIELLVVALVIGIITVPLGNVVLGYLRNTDETTARLNESHDLQIASAYWAADVSSIGTRQDAAHSYALNQSIEVGSATATPAWPYQCGTGGTVIVRFAWDDFNTAGVNTFTEVTYQTASGNSKELHRIRCNGSATPVSDVVVAHDLDPAPGQGPALSCPPDVPTVAAACSAAAVPTTVKLTLNIKDPKDRNTSAYTKTLIGQRRQAAT